MTVSQTYFDNIHRGHELDGWSRTGGQCTDESRYYMRDVLGIAPSNLFIAVPGANAKDWFRLANAAYFHKVPNTPTGIPPRGAIVVLNHGTFGHVFQDRGGSTGTRILGYGQNWTYVRRCAEEAHSGYVASGVIGWLVHTGKR